MKQIIRLIALCLAVIMCMTLAACGRQRAVVYYSSGYSESGAATDDNPQNEQDSSAVTEESGATTAAKDDKKTTGKVTTTTKGGSNRPKGNIVYRNFTVNQGTTTLEVSAKDAFKGKSYRSLIWTENSTEAYKKELQSFAAQYGCTISYETATFEKCRTTISTAQASGDAFDIIRMHAMWYPRILINNLCKPIEDSFTTADLTTDSNKAGIDLEKSSYFAWGNKLYAVTTYDDVPLMYLFYNKKMYDTYVGRGKDPLSLYKAGQWNWKTLKEHANIASNATDGRYYSDYSITQPNLVLSNGTRLITETQTNDGVALALSMSNNQKLINGLRFTQGLLGFGNGVDIYAPKAVLKTSGSGIEERDFVDGNTLVWVSESTRYEMVYNKVRTSGAFGSTEKERIDNLCIAPFPLGPDNQGGKFAGNWLIGFSAGRGSEATSGQLVAALCKYHSTYDNNVTVQPKADELEVMNKLYSNLYYPDYSYGTDDGNIKNTLDTIIAEVQKGKDITQTLKKYESSANTYLKTALGSQN